MKIFLKKTDYLLRWFFRKARIKIKDTLFSIKTKTAVNNDFTRLIRDNLERIELVTFEDLCGKYSILIDKQDIKIKYPPVLLEKALLLTFYSEIYALCVLAAGTKAKTIFEIGTFEGKTSANIANNVEADTKMYTLDFPLYKRMIDGRSVGKYIKEDPKASRIVSILEGDSLLFDFSPFYNKVDIMYVDGGTSYKCVLSDSEQSLKCVKKGGYIVWHDFLSIGKCYVGLVAAVFDFSRKYDLKLYLIDGTRLVVARV